MGYAMEASGEAANPVDTQNSYMLSAGQNLPNHSTSMAGRGKFVRQALGKIPEFRTKQQAYRYAAWLITMADSWLPDEEGCESHDFPTVLAAILNT
jgi:hypothetical protein